jgi:hypothetical protein
MSVTSETAELAILRTSWDRRASQLAVTYNDQQIEWELNCGGTTVWSGPANPEIRIDDRPLELAGQWEEVCSELGDDSDYFELEMCLASGRSLQRQILLARSDRFLLVSDVLVVERQVDIEYSHRLPLVQEISFHPAAETREGYFAAKRRVATVLPLAFPEWRSERITGELVHEETGLWYRMNSRARRLYAPLFIDLDPSRANKPLTWRRLTVAEHLEAQPHDVAAGYRVQIGTQQWLIYRSLAPRANRTVLGQNISTEFVVARFARNGKISELVEIE